MFYKLSNTATLVDIENEFDSKFKFPSIYQQSHLINGLSEQLLPVITLNEPNTINYAIWGLLPQNFKEDWGSFQNLTNTLNLAIETIDDIDWVNSLLNQQRCLVIVTGFFTSYEFEGEIYPFYVHDKNHKPFALAGIYSQLSDGFLSVSLVTSDVKNELSEVHNIGNSFPIALSPQNCREWLRMDKLFTKHVLSQIEQPELKAYTISKEFYKNDIIFDDILEPVHYKNLPTLSFK
ncbi:SOS response-associated peptidase family protein [Winogradskyella sp.]|uniref:SOS response-associated peptidase family protein n=1 Tax=Winogradskyella sp. TaxID=1883156 RepID=UPI003516858C